MADVRSFNTPSSVHQIVNELAAAFEATPVDTIEELVQGSFGELADGARIETYLPILTKRVVRERLRSTGS
jgi:hypothetical protein